MRKQMSRRTFHVFLWIIGVTLFLSAGTSEANSGRSPSFLFEVRDFRTGTLAARISDPQCADIDELVITGEALDGDDFAFIRKALRDLKVLNIRALSQNEISHSAFKNMTTLREIILPSTLQQIDWSAFAGCISLDRVVFPEDLTSIRGEAFADCRDLTRIVFPENLKYIGYASFRDCIALREIILPHTSVSIGYSAFSRCRNLRKVVLSNEPAPDDFPESSRDGLMLLGHQAFYECTALVSVDLPGEIRMIGRLAFGKCEALKHVALPKNLKEIMGSAFWSCTSLEELSLPDGLLRIGKFAFQGCNNLARLTLPEGLKSMGFGAFANCSALVQPVMPPNLTFVGEKAFEHNLTLPLSLDLLSHDLSAIREKVKERRARQPVDPSLPNLPQQHWIYDAIGQLETRGVFFCYPDCYRFPPAPRSQLFLKFAHGLLDVDFSKANKLEFGLLKALCVEFEEELEELGLKPELIDRHLAENGW